MDRIIKKVLIFLFAFCYSFAQIEDVTPEGVIPDVSAKLSFGFNYDYLQSPLKVSFDYPRGFFSINIPLKYSAPKSLANNLTEDLLSDFSDSAEFVPEASAKQNPNTTIKVDVPMMKGVASFSNMQMMYFRYTNTLGVPNLKIKTEEDTTSEISIFLRGMVSVPVDLSIGWETMTFGYAFEVNDKLQFAVNLHRHTFNFDMRGKIDLDVLGYFTIRMEDGLLNLSEKINYSLHNVVEGHYDAVTWTPTFAVKYWRASLISRFGMKINPKGFLKASYTIPFFIDPETFAIDDELLDSDSMTDYMVDNMDNFLTNSTNSVEYSTNKRMTWKMPQAHTLMFDVVPNKLSVSYTKLFGKIAMELYDPESDKMALSDSTHYPDTLDIRVSASVDHMFMIHGNFYSSFFNLGIFSLDIGYQDNDYLLSKNKALKKFKYGDGIIVPIFNLGALVGSKIKLLLELDLLPLTAFKTGIVYYF